VPIPTPEEIFAAADERIGESLLQDLESRSDEPSQRSRALAERLLAKHSPAEIVAHLLKREAERSMGTPKQVRDDSQPTHRESRPRKAGPRSRARQRPQSEFITYQVSWGEQAGADTRRLLAMVCRRGGVSSEVVGSIRVASNSSTVDIAASEAQRFERAVARPDKRNPRAKFRRWDSSASAKRPRNRSADARCA
jgi:ATP-dependent RNA helicase DeaD